MDDVGKAYDRRAGEYVERLGSVDQLAAGDAAVIRDWAGGVTGRILDAGCGPGHWTADLAADRPAVGIDLSAEFLASARRRFSDVPVARAGLGALPFPDRAFGGVLAWFSLIHTPPDDVPVLLRELARVLRPGGSLLVGFFDGEDQEPFDHAVAPAYRWHPDLLAEQVERAGFGIDRTSRRREDGMRPQAELIATRR